MEGMKLLARPIVSSLAAVAVTTFVLWLLRDTLTVANTSLIYALLVLMIAVRFGSGVSMWAAAACFLCINFFLLRPFYTFIVADPREVVDLLVFLLVAVIAGQLASRAKQQASQLEQSKVVEASDQLKTAILHAVSHDLRTPLTIIRSSAENLMQLGDKLSPDERHELVESIDRESRALNTMIGQLLDMSRLQAKAMPITLDWNSLEEVAGDAAAQTYERLGVKRLKLKFPEDMPLVRFDYGLLLRAVSNLIDNALRYEPENQKIELRGQTVPGEARLMVVNHGPPIPQDQREVLFQPFVTGHGGQLGLGLAIARGVVEAHKGRIWAEDTAGGGTTFVIALPVEREAQPV